MAKVTKSDIKQAVQNKVEETFIQSQGERLKSEENNMYTIPEGYFDDCPGCTEKVLFPNTHVYKNIKNKRWIVSSCPECKETVYISLKVYEKGDIINGYQYLAKTTLVKGSEIDDTPYNVISLKKDKNNNV